jgi:hypothetical protein
MSQVQHSKGSLVAPCVKQHQSFIRVSFGPFQWDSFDLRCGHSFSLVPGDEHSIHSGNTHNGVKNYSHLGQPRLSSADEAQS